jgi:GNAT superfamily N-acetyltransferase
VTREPAGTEQPATAQASPFRIEVAREADVPLVLRFINELAVYERLTHEVVATEADLRAALFGPERVASALLAYAGKEAVGFAVFFFSFSTFLGRPGLYLEDLYVVPEWRGRGLGRQLLTYLARIAVDRGCGRMEWSVLDWNETALSFYRGIGARPMSEWTVQRLSGSELIDLSGARRAAPRSTAP